MKTILQVRLMLEGSVLLLAGVARRSWAGAWAWMQSTPAGDRWPPKT